MERRGFFGSLLAVCAAPFLPKPKSKPKPVITEEMIEFGVRALDARRCGKSFAPLRWHEEIKDGKVVIVVDDYGYGSLGGRRATRQELTEMVSRPWRV